MPLTIALGLLAAKTLAELVLGSLNLAWSRHQGGRVPPELAGVVDEATFAKAQAYTLDRQRFSNFETCAEAALLAAVLANGVLPGLYHAVGDALGGGLWAQPLAVLAALFGLAALRWPFELWDQFVIEQKHGFNRQTLSGWVADQLKGAAVGLALGYPLLLGVLWVASALPLWWLWAWLLVVAFQLAALWLAPVLILPLFNKFTPLPEGPLRDRLRALVERCRFPVAEIFLVDGSRRSAHANAYFTGFGRHRRIALYDTLVKELSPAEIEAVLAHEIGHQRLGHIPQRLAVSAAFTGVLCAALGGLLAVPGFAEAFGFDAGAGPGAVLLLALVLGELLTFWLSPLLALWSRRHEYQADAFARDTVGSAEPLLGALRRLSQTNLANLVPHPFYSFFYHSHPTLPERTAALRAGVANG